MKVLLIQPPLEDFYTTPIRLYPLGLIYAAAVLEEAGWQVEILDCLSPLRKRQHPIPEEFFHLAPYVGRPFFFKAYHRYGISDEDIRRRVQAASPDLIGIAAQFTGYYGSVERLAGLIKSCCDAPIFIGGHHATAFPEETAARTPAVDFVLKGPAEECLPEFLTSQGMPFPNKNVNWTNLRPAHHLIPADIYTIGRKNGASMIASRGCPYQCDFCSVGAMYGPGIDYRSVEGVLEEMRWNYAVKKVRVFNFEDDNLSCDRQWFMEFLAAVHRDPLLLGIELTAMNGFCFNTLNGDVLSAMVEAGFKQLNISLVTGSAVVRQAYHRPGEISSLEPLVAEAKKLGLFVTVYLIIGLPGQTYEEVCESVDYLLDLGVLVGPSVFYLPPASPLYFRLSIPPEIRNNWMYYRSSAFAFETEELTRAQLIELFIDTRRKNLRLKGSE
jgi:radical SAM superfamily enzyme YgiQ (UPF0313 family)